MRFASLSSLMVAASCVLQCAFAMPIKVKMSGNEVQAKRGDSSPPSARLRQTDWREIQERQEMRKSYKRQQPSAVVHRRSIAFPGCPVVQGNFALARYPATDITTRSSASQMKSAATESDCLEACETYTSEDWSHDECVGYVFKPFTEMCYLKTNWTPSSFTSAPVNAFSSGSIAVLLDFSCSSAVASGVPASFSKVCCNTPT